MLSQQFPLLIIYQATTMLQLQLLTHCHVNPPVPHQPSWFICDWWSSERRCWSTTVKRLLNLINFSLECVCFLMWWQWKKKVNMSSLQQYFFWLKSLEVFLNPRIWRWGKYLWKWWENEIWLHGLQKSYANRGWNIKYWDWSQKECKWSKMNIVIHQFHLMKGGDYFP